MNKTLKLSLLSLMGCLLAAFVGLGVLCLGRVSAAAQDVAQDVAHETVAVHDPSVVIAYEDGEGKHYAESGEGRTKVYYAFGTQLSFAKSYDLVNWTPFTTNLHSAGKLLPLLSKEAAYAGHTAEDKLRENCWAPDVIWNGTMNRWCMYLSVNGDHQKSVIVLLTAEDLGGDWSYGGDVTFSRITSSNVGETDFERVTGSTTVDQKYSVYRNSEDNLLYGVNAIDAAVQYDESGELWMAYGSWFGGIYLLALDKETGLRDYTHTYPNDVDYTGGDPALGIASGNTFRVNSDAYLGIHLAGGHHAPEGGEGAYIERIGEYYYLFVSYGGYAPDGNYNMRVFRSEQITGPYLDGAGRSAIFANSQPDINQNNSSPKGRIGNRVMTGYSWSWWDFSYVAQGHNSVVRDTETGKTYLAYHNKYMDGTVFHVMKVHELLVTDDGWLVTSPFESNLTDTVATGLTPAEIAGDYGVLAMTRENGAYGDPVRETKVTLGEDGQISGAESGSWTYDAQSGAIELTIRYDSRDIIHKGYLLRQALEGTSISALALTAVSTDANAYRQERDRSMRTYWGYRYPDAETAGRYLASGYPIPAKFGEGARLPENITSDLWGGVTVSFAREDGSVVVRANGKPIGVYAVGQSAHAAEYDELAAGQKPVCVDNVGEISFDYRDYASDWTQVLSGERFRIYLSVLEYYDGTRWVSIFEAAGTDPSGRPGDWQAFFGSGRATVSFGADGSVTFSRDGTAKLTYAPTATFNQSSITIRQFTEAVKAEFKAGTVRSVYALKNVVLDPLKETGETDPPVGPEEPDVPEESENVKAFRQDVASLLKAEGTASKLAAIRTALSSYSALTDKEKESVSADYALLRKEIEAYNETAESVNQSYRSAVDGALGIFSAGGAALAGLALLAFIKRGGRL